MTVMQTTVITAKPGRAQDIIEISKKAKVISERLGARNVRLHVGFVAGEMSGTFVSTADYDDFAAAGKALDKWVTDPEGLALMASSTDLVASPWQGSMWIEVPL